MPLAIEQTRDSAGVRLVLLGDLNIGTAPALAERCLALLQAGERVCLDLSWVESVDGFGAGVLRAAVRQAQAEGRRLELEPNMRRRVRALLYLAGVDVPDRGALSAA